MNNGTNRLNKEFSSVCRNSLCFVVLLFTFNLFVPAWSSDSSAYIKVVYPKPESSIDAKSTFLVGEVPPDSHLVCNGESVRVNRSGFFAHVVRLHYGENRFLLVNTMTDRKDKLEWTVLRKSPPKSIVHDELKLLVQKPDGNLGITAGDTIYFSVRATPQANVSVQLSTHHISLSPLHNEATNTAVADGKTYHPYDSSLPDLYSGSYRVLESDRFVSIRPIYKLTCSKGSLDVIGKSSISTVDRLYVAHTIKTPTVARIGPGLARTTPLVEGVKLLIDGWSGEYMRCFYSPNLHVWIKKQDLIVEAKKDLPRTISGMKKTYSDGVLPQAVAQTINIIEDSYGEKICLPLNERLPYQVEQKLNPNCIIMRVYGVSADTDWVTNEPKSTNKESSMIDHISWRQVEDGVYEITVYLNTKRQWGYQVTYAGTTLCLKLKGLPKLTGDGSLRGLKICIDPGHGGTEQGSIGCSGVPESQLNYEISEKVKSCLESNGANVIMTRPTAGDGPSLEDRVKIATDNEVDFLVSIHNNALPDGRDPWKEHGTSCYWYHPQSIELAGTLKKAVKQASGFLDLGTRYQNLALARTTAMPAVLLEVGFMINPDEFSNLINPKFQQKIAQSIADGIKEYFSSSQNEPKLSN